MKKLFTLLTLAGAFLVANAQVTVEQSLYSTPDNTFITQDGQNASASIDYDGSTLLTIQGTTNHSSNSVTLSTTSNVKTITIDDQMYKALTIGGTSTSNSVDKFTITFGSNVESVTMYALNNKGVSNLRVYKSNSELLSETSLSETDGEAISLENGCFFTIGANRLSAVFLIKYIKTLPVTVSDFFANVTDVTATTAQIDVTYNISNAADDATYTLYYKDQANTDGEYNSVQSNSTGGTISLSSLTAETAYTYDVYLAVNGEKTDNASTTVDFTTLSVPTIPWTVNYAEIASTSIPWNTEIVVNDNPTEEDKSYITVDQSKNYKIGSSNANNFKFSVTYDGETLIAQDNVTTGSSGSITLSYAGPSGNNGNLAYTGLRGTSSSNRFGILDLKAGDIVEIAFLARNGYDSTVAPEESSLINLTYSSTNSDYVLTVDHNGEKQLNYKVFSYKVNEDGNAAFSTERGYLAYISVNPTESVATDVTLSPGADETMQSGVFNAETNSITMHSQEKQVTVFISCPEGAIPWYAVEAEKTGVNSPDFQPGNPSEMVRQRRVSTDLTYEEAKKYYDPEHENYANNGQYYVTLENETTGTLYIKYSYNDQEPTDQTPATFNFTVVKTDPTGVETIVVGEGETIYFDLSGRRVVNPEKGIFIKVEAGKVSKVIL